MFIYALIRTIFLIINSLNLEFWFVKVKKKTHLNIIGKLTVQSAAGVPNKCRPVAFQYWCELFGMLLNNLKFKQFYYLFQNIFIHNNKK